ncbi:putative microsomal signal peptidase subunit SPC12 [Talaromyces proteolyticus]|uniref:Signal peptidase complex subunit 1 n=1 Tax=Talaromyces proteolyticus TaxID=1131652 RepID=A0AAD4L2F2_9EURO|nr:putative microsomal signal peptidase subunit SPC12 [Talaromyces proteolyticus]KAH8702615.1 putative microsomal signal peptidase subunit SPC12 [Talaromyces proteolyticus]
MDNLLASLQDAAEGQIDFEGQRLAEMLSTVLLIIFGAASFVVGYIQQEIYLTLWIGIAGTAFTALVVVPPWPFYNQNPQPWLNSKTGGAVRNVPGIIVDGVKVG